MSRENVEVVRLANEPHNGEDMVPILQEFVEGVTDYLGVLSRWVERSLRRFKDVMEQPYSTLTRLPSAEELVGH